MTQPVSEPEVCEVCLDLSGERPLNPQLTVYVGQYWVVKHVYPVRDMTGWFVIVLKRHILKLSELSQAEYDEYTRIVWTLVKTLPRVREYEKEYLGCFGEKRGFHHLHVHLILKPYGLPSEDSGTFIFRRLKEGTPENSYPEVIEALCREVRMHLPSLI